MSARPVIDLDAYLERVGVGAGASLAEIHRAHVMAIPFESLDPHRGVPVALDPASLERKLVAERRGGYCFEQNLLLAEALEARGARVERLLGRVRWGAPPGVVRGRTHMALRVTDDDGVWHCDVGFGGGPLLEPLPFGPGGPYEQAGWRFRVVEDDDVLVLQTEGPDGWADVYAFESVPAPPVDIEISNWFCATHPESMFVRGLLVSAVRDDGTRLTLSDWGDQVLAVRTPSEATVTPVQRDEIPELLEREFGLNGFALGEGGRVVRAVSRSSPDPR